MKDTSVPTQYRFDNLEYLQDTVTQFDDGQVLLEEIVRSMSDVEYHQIYLYICRMHDIEPDLDKFNKDLEEEAPKESSQGKFNTEWEMPQ